MWPSYGNAYPGPSGTQTMRDAIADLIRIGVPDGVQVYPYPAEQIKVPAVVVGSMDWTPRTMNSLKSVGWEISIPVAVTRSKPEYGVDSLEALSLDVARALLLEGFRVEGFTTDGTEPVGGVDHLQGTLTVIYQTQEDS